jgi:hypothetical protein
MTRLRAFLRRLFRGADVTTCQRCGGAGTEPSSPTPEPLDYDRWLLRRAVQCLEDDGLMPHARALRTLLERLDGAP